MIDYDYMEAIDSMLSKARDAVIDGELMELDPGEMIACVGMMTERLRQAEKDSARYRWLRDESAFTHSNAPLAFFTDTNGDQISFDFYGSSYSVLHDEILDAAIDRAMNASNN